ncbi:MAG TPA: helix-turn-helix transcriptional regulator [Terriglobales bacterium]|nr:helix-turn-helix transcriptional regulator [Terriglobales bacterium]
MKWLKPREAAGELGVSYATLKQWLYQGKLEAVRTPGGHYRIAAAEIERLRGAPAAAPARISGRNQLRGTVTTVRREGLLAAVTLAIGDQQIKAVITAEAASELGLEPGMAAMALIKATEVMIMR